MATLARLYEKSGRHKAAIKALIQRQQYKEAILLAHRCINNRFLDRDVCFSMLKVQVYKQIKRAKAVDNADLIKIVSIIPSTNEQVHFLKEAKLYQEACELLLQQNTDSSVESAYRLCRAQHMFTKGIEIAKSRQDGAMKDKLILMRAENSLTTKTQWTLETKKEVESLLTVETLKVKAKALLLVSKYQGACAREECRQALELYKVELKNPVGEIEALNLLIEFEAHNVQIWHATMILEAIPKLKHVCALLEKTAAAYTSAYMDIEDFYGLERQGSDTYYLPTEQDLFISFTKLSQNHLIDSDGMMQLNRKQTLNLISKHLREYKDSWKATIKLVEELWKQKVERSFPFHSEVVNKPYYLCKKQLKVSSEQLKEYFKMLELAFQANELNSAVFQKDILALEHILSPFSQLIIRFQKDDFLAISRSKIFHSALMTKMIQELKMTAESPNIDGWLQIWKTMHIMGKEAVDKMNGIIEEQRQKILTKAKTHVGYKPTRSKPFTYIESRGSYISILAVWERSCQQFREKDKVLLATNSSFNHFIQVIARRSSLRSTFSLQNLINILMIQTTALLAMISASCFRNRKQMSFFLPDSFDMTVKTFNLVNCSSQDTKMLTACFNTSSKVAFPKIINDAVELLTKIVYLIVGLYNKHYNPLSRAVKRERTEAIHCFLLLFTIVGNLQQNNFLSPSDTQFIYQTIHTDLAQHITSSTTEYKQKVLLTVSNNLARSKTGKDIFDKVMPPLLQEVSLSLVLLQTVNSMGKQEIRIKPFTEQGTHAKTVSGPVHVRHSHDINKNFDASAQSIQVQASYGLEKTGEMVKPDSETPLPGSHQEETNTPEQRADLESQAELQSLTLKEPESDRQTEESELSDEMNSDEEEVLETLFADAEENKYVQPLVDTELEKEKEKFFDGTHCIICEVEVGEDEIHFKEKSHLDREHLFGSYRNAEITYNITQKHLEKVIAECQRVDTEYAYELETDLVSANQLIKSNEMTIVEISQNCSWEQRIERLKYLRDRTQTVVAELDKKQKQIEERIMRPAILVHEAEAAIDHDDKNDHDDTEQIVELLERRKLKPKRQKKKK